MENLTKKEYQFMWSFTPFMPAHWATPTAFYKDYSIYPEADVFQYYDGTMVHTYIPKEDLNEHKGKHSPKFLDPLYYATYVKQYNNENKRWWKWVRSIETKKYSEENILEITKDHATLTNFLYDAIAYFGSTRTEFTYTVEQELKKHIMEKYDRQWPEIFGTLTSPVVLDDIQREEINWHSITANYTSDYQLLKHAEQFPWTIFGQLDENKVIKHLRNRQENTDKTSHYNILKELSQKFQDRKKEQQVIQNAFGNKCDHVTYLSHFLQEQAVRRMDIKSFWGGAVFLTRHLWKEIAQHLGIELNDILAYMTPPEVQALLNKDLSIDILEKIKKRKKGFVIYYNKGEEITIVEGNRAKMLYTERITKVNKERQIIQGKAANLGVFRGKVRKVLPGNLEMLNKDIEKFQEKEILVTSMTQPNMMFIAKKAGAIITDEGGITSHAAIISRELNIPCIIGCQDAMHILDNGDEVEVNADSAIVKIIQRQKTFDQSSNTQRHSYQSNPRVKRRNLKMDKFPESASDKFHNKNVKLSLAWEAVQHTYTTYANIVAYKERMHAFCSYVEKTHLIKISKGHIQAYHDKNELVRAGRERLKDIISHEWVENFKYISHEAIREAQEFTNKYYQNNRAISYDELSYRIKKATQILSDVFTAFCACQPQCTAEVETYLKNQLSSQYSDTKKQEIITTLSLSTEQSPMLQEEIDRHRLIIENTKILNFQENIQPELTSHIRKHGLTYAADGHEPMSIDNLYKKLFGDQKQRIENPENIWKIKKKQIKQQQQHIKKSCAIHKHVIQTCEDIAAIGHLRLCLRAQGWMPLSYIIIRELFTELEKYAPYTHQQLEACRFHEIEQIIEGNFLVTPHELDERHKLVFFGLLDGEEVLWHGQEAQTMIEELVPNINTNIDTIRGQVAMKGYQEGTCYVIKWDDNDPTKAVANMPEGAILIVGQTRPQLMPAIKKASAIVTDEGGITSHAAIVSREFGIPCIIGTHIATKVLKTGDKVIVDTQKGTVKKR